MPVTSAAVTCADEGLDRARDLVSRLWEDDAVGVEARVGGPPGLDMRLVGGIQGRDNAGCKAGFTEGVTLSEKSAAINQ